MKVGQLIDKNSMNTLSEVINQYDKHIENINESRERLKKFKELFPDKIKLRVRFSLDNLKMDDDVLNIPLFMADQTDRLIGLALEQRKI